MGTKAERAARARAAALLGSAGGKVVTARKRAHLKSIAKLGAAARWGKRAPKGGG